MGLGEVGLGDVGVRRAELVLCLLLPRSPKLRVKMRLRLSTASNRDLRRSWEGVPSEQFRKSRGAIVVQVDLKDGGLVKMNVN